MTSGIEHRTSTDADHSDIAEDSRGRVLVAMSGGVDSSVTAYLLQQQGYDCVGTTMRLFDRSDPEEAAGDGSTDRDATSSDVAAGDSSDIDDARAVATRLGMPYHVLDCEKTFSTQVIDRFVEAYLSGATPNPCVLCNRYLKFGQLYRFARELGCDYIATGHYARITRDAPDDHAASGTHDGICHLRCGVDPDKDQSYVLHVLSSEQLAHTLLPLGGLTKNEVRAIAEEQGFVNARKDESQDICFIPDNDYARFLEKKSGTSAPGDFLDQDGRVIGHHRGIIHYTIGQRKGLGIAAAYPLYVLRIDAGANTVVLGPREALVVRAFEAHDVNWTAPDSPTAPFTADIAVRYQGPRCPAHITPVRDASGNCHAHIEPLEELRAVAPGQAVVFYLGDEVLGGGTIALR